jgi:Pectate lyase superfamily protein
MLKIMRALAFAFALLFSISPATAAILQYMLPVYAQPYGYNGFLLAPGATVTIYLFGTSTKATLYNQALTVIGNPMTADAYGFVNFWADATQQYSMVVSLGTWTGEAIYFPPPGGSGGSGGGATIVSNVAALKGTGISASGQLFQTLGYTNSNDGGGNFYVTSTSACSLNGGTGDNCSQIKPTSGTGCYLTQFNATYINTVGCGADPTGATDSTAAAKNALAVTAYSGMPADVWFPPGTYLLTNSLPIGNSTQSQCLKGSGVSTVFHVTSAFSPSATGVMVPVPNTSNQQVNGACLKNFYISFDQPVDFTTTMTSASVAANTNGPVTITVASATGITNGMNIVDNTHSGATYMPDVVNQGATQLITVTGVAGNNITINTWPTTGGKVTGSAGITTGDTLAFGSSRTQFANLGTCTTTTGGTGCKYPWAIYAANVNENVIIDGVYIGGAWDGVYVHGQTEHIGLMRVGAFDIAIDMGDNFNFSSIATFECQAVGIDPTGAQNALVHTFYDGSTVCGNFGRVDGIDIGQFESWNGKLVIGAGWTFGTITSLSLDGLNANLDIIPSAASFLNVGDFYITKGLSFNVPVYQTANAGFNVSFANVYMTCGTQNGYACISLAGGNMSFNGGFMFNGQAGSPNHFAEIGASSTLKLNNMLFSAAGGQNNTWFYQTGGSTELRGSTFLNASGGSGIGFASTGGTSILDGTNNWNGWIHPMPSNPNLSGKLDLTGQANNIAATTIFTTPAQAGTYRVSCFTVVTQAATTSSTLPSCGFTWTDADSAQSENASVTGTNAGNVVGRHGLTGTAYGQMTIRAAASTAIQVSTSGYLTSGATSMQYATHAAVESITP